MANNQYGRQYYEHPTYPISNQIILTSDKQSTGQYIYKYQGENTD